MQPPAKLREGVEEWLNRGAIRRYDECSPIRAIKAGEAARPVNWTLTAIMLAAYFGYILLIAFDKAVLARPIGAGVTSLGIPIGVGIILLAILLTGLYVRRANREYDPLVRALQAGEPE